MLLQNPNYKINDKHVRYCERNTLKNSLQYYRYQIKNIVIIRVSRRLRNEHLNSEQTDNNTHGYN